MAANAIAVIKGLAEAESKSINLNVVCLRFDAFYVGLNDVYFPLCPPVFSHAINNLKSALTGELKIVRMDHCTSPANGGREIFLLVERVTKKNIKVRFYELDDDDNLLWEDYGKFNDLDVHHQYAIVLKTPPYKNRDITSQANVYMELVRPSDNARSDTKTFTYIPMQSQGRPGSKRSRPNDFDSKDYDTPLSIGSDILPTTIQNISGDLDILNLAANLDSDDLLKAYTDINSDEFTKLYARFSNEYEPAALSSSDNSSNLSMDFPCNRENMQKSWCGSSGVKTYMANREYEVKTMRVYREISEFLKTHPKPQEIKNMVRYYLTNSKNESDWLNAFHMAVMLNNSRVINFFVKLIYLTQEFDLINIQSKQFGTVLHLATWCNNVELIERLILTCNADITKRDARFNTPLHIAAVEDAIGNALKMLLKAKDALKCINLENESGDTALHLAVKKKNFGAAQILCHCGADVDYRHKSNGFTALRFAVQNEDLFMVDFLLNEAKANPKVRDFSEVDPFQVVLHSQSLPKIQDLIEKYMEDNKISCDEISIKEEPEDDTSEDEMVISEQEIKIEPLDLPNLYQNVTNFTNECLEQVCSELDASGKWQDLAVLLDVEHLLRLQTFDENRSPSKQLLNYIIASNDGSVKEIRDFLEHLDEKNAVLAIDRMVQEMYSSSS
ncbi:hypothetical protein HHI36_013066 [Cryptolaemus montrouzieri]|uniref:IPT/TIG domain-containing protein n=1 Tax=Cryptolaemus montrouzieri TaxID=559131 RepID=A0ABD2NG35_9CUCU